MEQSTRQFIAMAGKLTCRGIRRALRLAASFGALYLGLTAGCSYAMDTDQTTFNGEVAGSCEFRNLPDQVSLTYDSNSNGFLDFIDFALLANISEFRISAGQINMIQEPANIPTGSKVNASVTSTSTGLRTGTARLTSGSTSQTIQNTPNQEHALQLYIQVMTGQATGGKWQLLPGEYSYSMTISCLQ